MKYACLCCGYRTLDEPPPGTLAICEVCGWEDDNVQATDPNVEGGANPMSLRVARVNYRAYRSREPAPGTSVRPPREEEGPALEVDVLAGREVTQIRVDHAVSLLGEHDLLLIGVPFALFDPDGTSHSIDVEQRVTEAATALDRLHRTVMSGVYLDGQLKLVFDDRVELVVPANPEFESWILNRQDGSMVVCSPGGELVVWGPAPEHS